MHPSPTATRVHWVDRLRVVVIAGVVVVHAATAYVVDVDWYYEERTTSTLSPLVLSAPVLVLAVFGLAPLYLVAGWLSVGALSRRGAGGFARSRLLRLGVPLVAFLLIVDPVTDYLGGQAEGWSRTLWSFLSDPGGSRDLGPMWFVAVLLVLQLLYGALRRASALPERGTTGIGVGSLAWLALAVAVADFTTWLWSGYGSATFWNLNWPHWPQAAGLFLLGVLIGERGWGDLVQRRVVRRCGLMSVLGCLAFAGLATWAMTSRDLAAIAGGWHWASAAFALVDGVVAVVLSVWLVGWFRAGWDAPPGAVISTAARASYATYVLHPLVLVALSAAARPMPWPPEAKFVLVAAAGVPACFAVGWLVTRVPVVNRVL